MEDEDLRNTIERCFMTYVDDERVNIVDGLFAIADSISALDLTVGAEPTIDMNKKLCESLDGVGSAIADIGNAIREHGDEQ